MRALSLPTCFAACFLCFGSYLGFDKRTVHSYVKLIEIKAAGSAFSCQARSAAPQNFPTQRQHVTREVRVAINQSTKTTITMRVNGRDRWHDTFGQIPGTISLKMPRMEEEIDRALPTASSKHA